MILLNRQSAEAEPWAIPAKILKVLSSTPFYFWRGKSVVCVHTFGDFCGAEILFILHRPPFLIFERTALSTFSSALACKINFLPLGTAGTADNMM